MAGDPVSSERGPFEAGRPLVFRNGLVLTMVGAHAIETWIAGMHPEVPARTIRENPYRHIDFGGDFR
jgi:hypothetical protein